MALVHYTVPPVVGGVEAILAEQARQLRASGYDVRVIAGRGDAELVPELDSRHPEIEALTHALARDEPDPGRFARLKARILAGLKAPLADRDVVIAHNALTLHLNLPLTAALTQVGKPLIAWTHDLTWANPRYAEFQRDREPYTLTRDPQAGALYVAISELRRRELADILGVPARGLPVIPNGIDAERFLGLSGPTRALARIAGFEAADPMLLVPVRITRRKRLELAVEAAGRLRERHAGLRVVISGPLGPHSADNATYARELFELRARLGLDGVVQFLHEHPAAGGGHPVDDRMMNELYRLADAILVTSEAEGFGLPVLEAGLARAPLVCTDLAVLREVGGGGLHTFPAAGGSAEVAEAVESALRGRAARLRRRVLTEYTWPAVMKRTEAVIARA